MTTTTISMFPFSIRFTPAAASLLLHRLEAADCIADALSDDEEDAAKREAMRVAAYAAAERVGLRMTEQKGAAAVTVLVENPWDLAVLIDAAGGSTLCALSRWDGVPAGDRRATLRAAAETEAGFRAAGFAGVRVPRG